MADFRIDAVNRSGVAIDLDHAKSITRFAMAQLRLHPRTQLSLNFVDLAEMERLHIEYMDEPGATDVLSFPMDELRAPAASESAIAGELGDIVISPQFVEKQAADAGNSFTGELELLLVHGVLHLLGHDHAEPEEHAVMFGLQAKLLDAWRVSGSADA